MPSSLIFLVNVFRPQPNNLAASFLRPLVFCNAASISIFSTSAMILAAISVSPESSFCCVVIDSVCFQSPPVLPLPA